MNKLNLDEKLICDLYLANNSLSDIKKIINVSQGTVAKILRLNGVIIRSKAPSRKQLNSHNLDLKYFEKIDSFDKAYWLGIIASDGTIQKDGYKTALISKDKDLIVKFKKAIQTTHPISVINRFDKRTNKVYSSYMIQIGSKEFTSYIIKQGVTNRKGYHCEFPKIEEKYYLSFIRGLFDGDGSLGKSSKNTYRMSFTATREILEFIQKFFLEKYNTEPHPIYATSEKMNVFRTHYFADTKKILSLLYEDSNDNNRLKRKYKLYNKI